MRDIAKTLRRIRYGRINSALTHGLRSLLYREGKSYRLLFGPLKGYRLYYDPALNFHTIFGLWEQDALKMMAMVFQRSGLTSQSATIADVGANIGYISLWFSYITGGRCQVYSFEPSPWAHAMLEKNIALNNRAANIHPVKLACSDQVGETTFFIGTHHHSSSLVSDWAWAHKDKGQQLTVQTTTLDDFFLKDQGLVPDFIKMDIEGGGVFALRGVEGCIRAKQPLFWVESHIPEEDQAISRILTTYDYTGYRLSNRKFVKHPGATHPDPDGVSGTLLLIPPRLRDVLIPALKEIS